MATEITVPMDDKELFQSAMADEPTQETPVEEKSEEKPSDERPRDEHGRFVSQDAKPEEKPAAEAAPIQQQAPEIKPDEGGQVPSWRLREVREAREAAERRAEEALRQSGTLQAQLQAVQRQLSELQKPKQEPVDFYTDPDGRLNQEIAPLKQELSSLRDELRLEMSRELAVVKHGEQAVAEMEAAVQKAIAQNSPEMIALAAQIRASRNPASVAMDWYKRSKILEQTGGDLEAWYAKRKAEEAAKVPEPAQDGRPNVKLPPSLTKATGAGISNALPDDGDMSDRALFRHAMAPNRR